MSPRPGTVRQRVGRRCRWHVWRHTRHGDKYVTVIIDLTPIRDGTGPRTLHTRAGLLTDKQIHRLRALFAVEEHVEVEATWGIHQRMIAAYRHEDRRCGRDLMTALIDSVSHGVPAALAEVVTLGRTLKKRADDVLAYFDWPGTGNGPTEAISGRLEHLRGSALGFRNLTNYIARSLLETGGFGPRLHP